MLYNLPHCTEPRHQSYSCVSQYIISQADTGVLRRLGLEGGHCLNVHAIVLCYR